MKMCEWRCPETGLRVQFICSNERDEERIKNVISVLTGKKEEMEINLLKKLDKLLNAMEKKING